MKMPKSTTIAMLPHPFMPGDIIRADGGPPLVVASVTRGSVRVYRATWLGRLLAWASRAWWRVRAWVRS